MRYPSVMPLKQAIVRWAWHMAKALRRAPKRPQRLADLRIDADAWLKDLFETLTDRYRLGEETPHGLQILRRTGRARFNPMRVYVRSGARRLAADYDVRIRDGRPLDFARSLLDQRIGAPLAEWGLKPSSETVEDWGGQVITRRYEGH